MPSYVNIMAYVYKRIMLVSWDRVDSCVQISKNVHLSGSSGINGVLKQLQAVSVII
jgi:2,3,4,5-tetrahydropyridine-2,6-dicarboxylate N-succinyltransferase